MSSRRVKDAVEAAIPVEDVEFDLYAPAEPKGSGGRRRPRASADESHPDDGDQPGDGDDFDGGEPPAPPVDGSEGGSGDEGGNEVLADCAAEPETDIGNGRRLLHRHRDRLLNVANRGIHVFDGKRWAWDETDSLARKHCHDTVEKIADERMVMALYDYERKLIDEAEANALELKGLRAIKVTDLSPEQKGRIIALGIIEDGAMEAKKNFADRKRARSRHAKSSASSAKIDNMLREAAPYITRTMNDMDPEPLALNCLSGTVRFFDANEGNGKALWDVRCDPHDREDLITKCCAAAFDLDAEAFQFEAFLEEMQPDYEVRSFIQRYLGYCILGLTHEQVFAFFHGGGRNGKSTLVDIVCRIIADYSATVPIETLAGEQRRKGGDATPDLMRVPGARLVRASEPESSMKFKEAMIKSLTSDEPILIRGLHKDFIEIYPSFKLIVSGNHKPRIDNDDNGIWRRVLLVPWGVQLAKERADKHLGRKLWGERDGIFAWLIRGALSYLQEGLNVPAAVLAATDEYRSDSNPIGACLDAYFEFTTETTDRLDPGEIFNVYERARHKQGWPQFGLATFNKRLPEQALARGSPKHKSMGLSTYLGIRISEAGRELMRSSVDPRTPSDGGSDVF